MTYRVDATKDAEKELQGFPRGIQKSLLDASDLLSDPFSTSLHGHTRVLTGYEYIWRMKVGNRRIFYVIDKAAKVVTIIGYSIRNDLYDKSTKRSLDAAEKIERRKHGGVDEDLGM